MKHRVPHRERDALIILVGGMLGMVIAMGIGRFAFTPILPLMQRDLGMSHSVAGWLAGLNYLGYLVGAVWSFFASRQLRSHHVAIVSLIVSILTTVAMGWTEAVAWWVFLRFVGGVASAMLFIIISAEVGETLLKRGYGHWVGAIYGGVGAGIVLSGLAIPWFDQVGQWDGAWIGIGGVAAILAVLGIVMTKGKIDAVETVVDRQPGTKRLRSLWALIVAYFFQGLGYIVTATFLVAIIAATPGLEAYASYSWVAVGLAAVPSTILWPMLSRRVGSKKALLAAYAIQASGILVSMYADSVLEVMFAAMTFGGTFMGIVALTLAEGYSRMPQDGKRATAILTTSFGIGQILGPVLAGFLADMQKGFVLPLFLASICVMIGLGFIVFDRHFVLQKQ